MKLVGLLDCNNFFVSCERLFRPDLTKTPVAVLSSNDGCIVARSAEIKAMGVPMGLPLFQAKQLVDMDKVVLFSSNFTLYRDISARVMQVLREEVGEIDVYSIDEAFFELGEDQVADITNIRKRIMQKVGIPVSIGLASTKTLAKVASEMAKKGGGTEVLTKTRWREKASEVQCSQIWGLGRATVSKLKEFNINTAAEFMQTERRLIRQHFGVAGERIYDELHGVAVAGARGDDRQKSIMSTRSFAKTTNNLTELQSAVAYHVAHVAKKLRERELVATMMYLELRASRHGDFSHRRGGTEVVLPEPTNSTQDLTKEALAAVARIHDPEVPYKKAGVIVAGLVPEAYTSPSLFETATASTKQGLDSVLDTIQDRFGFQALHSAAILPNADRSSRQLRSQSYTTLWKDIPRVGA